MQHRANTLPEGTEVQIYPGSKSWLIGPTTGNHIMLSRATTRKGKPQTLYKRITASRHVWTLQNDIENANNRQVDKETSSEMDKNI